MSRGNVGKRAIADWVTDTAIRKILDYLAVHRPELWETLHQQVQWSASGARTGLIAGAELIGMLKDALGFLPDWMHRILDAGLSQSPTSIVRYFELHGNRAAAASAAGSVPELRTPQDLEQQVRSALGQSPEMRKLATDAQVGRIFLRMQEYRGTVERTLRSDVRYTLLSRYQEELERRNPTRESRDQHAASEFAMWFLRQNDTVGAVLAQLLESGTAVPRELDLLRSETVRRFQDMEEPERFRFIERLATALGRGVTPAEAPVEPGTGPEPADPGERFRSRQKFFEQQARELIPSVEGTASEYERFFRAIFEDLNGPMTEEDERLLGKLAQRIHRLSKRRRKTFVVQVATEHNGHFSREYPESPRQLELTRKNFSRDMLQMLAGCSDAELHELADTMATLVSAMPHVLGTMTSGLFGGLETAFGDDPPK
jgi:hypothetical protein